MDTNTKTIALTVAGALAVAGAFVAIPTLAGAASSSTPTPTASSSSSADSGSGESDDSTSKRDGKGGQGETALTGDTAAKVKAAALAKVPGGTILRVETDNDGVYEAHMTKADGTEVVVAIDKNFAVTGVETHNGRGGGRDGGHGGGRGGQGETALTGDTAAKVKAAALAKVPGGTILRVETDNDGVYEAHVTKADGTEVVVAIDKNFAVTGVETRGAKQ